ncbi:hypothetical protein FA95DRAFT_1494092, partial [Auriscalpium vulgare]
MIDDDDDISQQLGIWQQNLNKSHVAQHHLVNLGKLREFDVIAIQEPYIKRDSHTYAGAPWRVVYPSTHFSDPSATRALYLVRDNLDTNSWQQIDFPSGDVCIIQITGEWGQLTIFNVYNPGDHD